MDGSNVGGSIQNFAYDSLESLRKKLLDLTSRNSLLNYRHPKTSCIRIIDELPDQLTEVLRSGNELTFIPVPEPTEVQLLEKGFLGFDEDDNIIQVQEHPNAEKWAKILGFATSYELPLSNEGELDKEIHQDTQIQTLLYSSQLEAHLRSIASKSKIAIEESGADILYLAIGYLEWFEDNHSQTKRTAPLFTLPVKLERVKDTSNYGRYVYNISLKDEGLMTNVTLSEKLANDFGLVLPEVSDDITPEVYFRMVQDSIVTYKPAWKVKRQATLALLNFSKQAMYQDLDPTSWPEDVDIQNHPLVSMFFSSAEPESSSGAGYLEEHSIDEINNVHEDFPLIYDADSSQHSALIDAVEGENIVIEGPPGSGKSQTITNLIAACIANGKKVLFVAEKMAALNVVKSRLDRAGLGDFCLELHSHKSNKQKILSNLERRINKQEDYRAPVELRAEISRYEDLKNKLHAYVNLINSKWDSTELTLHEIFHKATRLRESLKINPNKYVIEGVAGDTFTPSRQRELLDLSNMLIDIFEQVSEQAEESKIENHYWYGITNFSLMGFQYEELQDALSEWNIELKELNLLISKIDEIYCFGFEEDLSTTELSRLCTHISKLPDLHGEEPLGYLIDGLSPEFIVEITRWAELYQTVHKLNDELSKVIDCTLLEQMESYSSLENLLSVAETLGIQSESTITEYSDKLKLSVETRVSVVEIENTLSEIKESFPQEVKNIFVSSLNGLLEFQRFFSMVLELPIELWRYRDEIYDNPDLDPVLEQVSKQLNWLAPLHKKLSDKFNLQINKGSVSLKRLEQILLKGGILKWFSSDWRAARKELLSISIGYKPKLNEQIELLPELIKYSEGIEELDGLNSENDSLEGVYAGVDTPIERALVLRAWYKKVREVYGSGFGPMVAVGDSILRLDRRLVIGLNELQKQGFGASLQKQLESIKNLTVFFSRHEGLSDGDSNLLETLDELNELLGKSLNGVEQIVLNGYLSFGEAKKSLHVWQDRFQKISEWDELQHKGGMESQGCIFTLAPKGYSESAKAVIENAISFMQIVSESDFLNSAFNANTEVDNYRIIQNLGADIKGALETVQQRENSFKKLGQVVIEDWLKSCGHSIKAIVNRNVRAIDNPKWLDTWVDYLKLKEKLTLNGLEQIISELELKSFEVEDIKEVITLVIYHQLSNEILAQHSSLAMFNGMEQMTNRKQFQEYDKKIMQLQRELVAYRASRKEAPRGVFTGKVSEYTEISLIKHNINLKKPRIAVRSLLKRAGSSIQALKPCFMMSPMSVAQYLEPGKFDFDIVIMDEASQIKPEDALGAIARARSLVVVGDPKQLPPTAFFQKALNNEDDDEKVALEDSESILESVIPMFKTRRLRWHYRSRHESLIAFSNYRFYDSDLILFPSPMQDTDEFGIRYTKAEKGRFVGRRNSEEAKEVVKSLKNQLIEKPEESVGIVAMSSEQRDEIERAVEQALKDDPIFFAAYDKNLLVEEPLFIKNLENVQGDERDVIIISMTYGPETVGATSMYQRFGPINSDVGWRRLNVLFTRSKKRMHILSSMDSGHIRSSEKSSRGVTALKAFLEYCETGRVQHYEHTGKAADSDFEIAVMDALAAYGYECEPQLGVAGYFLDIAVKDPGQPGRFLMAIECDGATYHSAKSTRDRDRLRQEILENLGWRVRRIWSTDWFKNPEAQLQPILNELDRIKTKIVQVEESVSNISQEVELVEKVKEFRKEEPSFDLEEDGLDLRERLIKFDDEIIRPSSNTAEGTRLLRPAMLEALIKFTPYSKAEFVEVIPQFLREGTASSEGDYLDDVLTIISKYA